MLSNLQLMDLLYSDCLNPVQYSKDISLNSSRTGIRNQFFCLNVYYKNEKIVRIIQVPTKAQLAKNRETVEILAYKVELSEKLERLLHAEKVPKHLFVCHPILLEALRFVENQYIPSIDNNEVKIKNRE